MTVRIPAAGEMGATMVEGNPDTGSEVNTASYQTTARLEALGYRVAPAQTTDAGMFGREDNIQKIDGWIHTNSVLGKIAVIDMETNLISIGVITRNGIEEVAFRAHQVRMTTVDNEIVIVGEQDERTKLYTIDIMKLLRIPRKTSAELRSVYSVRTVDSVVNGVATRIARREEQRDMGPSAAAGEGAGAEAETAMEQRGMEPSAEAGTGAGAGAKADAAMEQTGQEAKKGLPSQVGQEAKKGLSSQVGQEAKCSGRSRRRSQGRRSDGEDGAGGAKKGLSSQVPQTKDGYSRPRRDRADLSDNRQSDEVSPGGTPMDLTEGPSDEVPHGGASKDLAVLSDAR